MITEADTCRKYVLPKLYKAGWSDDQISEQKTFTDGRIIVIGDKVQRKKPKRADYILRIARNFPVAVIEAKSAYKKPGDGLQQAKEYAEILGLKFAYSTNGRAIVEHDYITGLEREVSRFSSPSELWNFIKTSEGTGASGTSYFAPFLVGNTLMTIVLAVIFFIILAEDRRKDFSPHLLSKSRTT